MMPQDRDYEEVMVHGDVVPKISLEPLIVPEELDLPTGFHERVSSPMVYYIPKSSDSPRSTQYSRKTGGSDVDNSNTTNQDGERSRSTEDLPPVPIQGLKCVPNCVSTTISTASTLNNCNSLTIS
jgi:hypothetical protein